MNLHVFNDTHGFVLNLTVERFSAEGSLEHHHFVNLNDKSIFRHERVTYLKGGIRDFREYINGMVAVQSIKFYPFDFQASYFLKEFRRRFPDCPASWIFWSYEFYHRPDLYASNLEGHSAKFVRDRRVMRNLSQPIKRLLGIPVFNKALLEEGYGRMKAFYSFLPGDYEQVRAYSPSLKCPHRQFSFLSIESLKGGGEWELKERGSRILIGNSASMTINHAEIIERLAKLPITNELLVPLEYGGQEDYVASIRELARMRFGARVAFLEERLEMARYYERISDTGFAVFNFRWQEALGNILFLVWNGAKVFLREESSAFRQYQQWGIRVFSFEAELTADELSVLLPADVAASNRRILESIFSEKMVMEYWRSLME